MSDPKPCSVEGCDRFLVPPYGRGMCGLHYGRWLKHGDPLHVRPRRNGVEQCTVEGCDKLQKANAWCAMHLSRWYRFGSPTARLRGQVVDGKRICSRCHVDKPQDQFGRVGESWCKRCQADNQIEIRARPDYVRPVQTPEYQAAAARKWRAQNPDQVRAQAAVYRARRAGATTEHFSPREVFERDNWTCGLCESSIDRCLTYPNPMSVSLDHVVPLSLGGDHSRANTQATHLVCNLRKHTSLTGAVV